jgi:hypothetical protein
MSVEFPISGLPCDAQCRGCRFYLLNESVIEERIIIFGKGLCRRFPKYELRRYFDVCGEWLAKK